MKPTFQLFINTLILTCYQTINYILYSSGLSYDKLPPLPDNVQVACHNSFDNTTISGPAEDVEEYIKILRRQNIIVRIVNSNNVAYHSRQVEPLAPYVLENIRKVSKKLKLNVPRFAWVFHTILIFW